MSQVGELRELSFGKAHIQIYASRQDLGAAAARRAAELIQQAVREKGRARIMVATGNSQLDVVAALALRRDIPWDSVEVFHMDEYVGIEETHPSSFRYWIYNRLERHVHPARIEYIQGDAPDLDAEIARYSKMLSEAPMDLAFVGFGENGHIAFNDPHVADFQDPAVVKRVLLDDVCRAQQAGEGHFANIDSVPKEALTVTCSGLFSAASWVCAVPERRKAEAVRNALEGPISPACPASLVRRHPTANVYLDQESASLLSALSDNKSPA
ncbi:MAG TPA: glucosamine-6-phosphate deaminase [Bryobacteraceae bacterium]|jgi:6-phosphogluconolactonase/Glucosamine-6-phosphate isomerase/deaminase|nr:glucosamine-6-phosphate deaminase [Bryobacteraceae bacterium]